MVVKLEVKDIDNPGEDQEGFLSKDEKEALMVTSDLVKDPKSSFVVIAMNL